MTSSAPPLLLASWTAEAMLDQINTAKTDVFGDRELIFGVVLEHGAEKRAQSGWIVVAEGSTFEQDLAAVRIVEATEEFDDSAFASTITTDQRDRFARSDGEGDIGRGPVRLCPDK